MGAESFMTIQLSTGTSDDAYQLAVTSAITEYGINPYNGTISTTDGYQIIDEPRPKYGSKDFFRWVYDTIDNKCEKWGKAGCIELTPAELKHARSEYRWRHLKGKHNVGGWYFFGIASI